MNVVFAGGGTGGHLYPGLAIARALVRIDPSVRPFFIGAERGIERTALPGAGFPFALLPLHPLYRRQPWNNWKTVAGALAGWGRLGAIMREQAPSVVVGTGGYASALTLAWAIAHGVPTVQQVADAIPGMTARAFGRWARVLYLGFGEAERWMSHGSRTEVLVTGNPVDPPPAPRPTKAAARATYHFSTNGTAPVVLIFGGSQGAQAINQAVDAWLTTGLPTALHLIWSTGPASYHDYKQWEGNHVTVRPYLSPIADAYAACDVAVTRAGAMTCAELAAWGIPAILVPLPTAAADHQTGNARALADAGAAVLLTQAELTGTRLAREVGALVGDANRLETMANHSREIGRPNAAEVIARHILASFK